MTAFIDEQMTEYISTNMADGKLIQLIENYKNFLKQPLKLEMFVPCVDNEPFNYSKHGNKEQFEQAKEKVLFEHEFPTIAIEFILIHCKKIEDILSIQDE